MLAHLSLKDFAIVENLALDFNPGMSALTGETGAGKSIAIDALQIALGARVDASIVRHGKEQADISALFDVQHIPRAQAWLTAQEYTNEDNEVLVRRIISREGRTKQFINGQACTQQQLRELGELLVNIHGQHEHQALLKKEHQRELVDQFGGHQNLLQPVQNYYTQWQTTQKKLAQLNEDTGEKNAKLTLLEHYVAEFTALDLQKDELTTLEAEHKQLANGSELSQALQATLLLLSDSNENNAQALLNNAQNTLATVTNLSPKLTAITELLDSTQIQLQEAVNDLQDFSNQLDMDPNRLQWLEQRLSAIYALARKHHVNANQLPEHQEQLIAQLQQLQHADEFKEKLTQELTKIAEQYQQAAQKLTAQRKKTAADLGKQITAHMQTLGMQGGQFSIHLEPLNEMSMNGNEKIEFLVSANPGYPLQPLNKVASGGELSRISLAIQMLTAQKDDTPTLIFDEVDTGIGGATAEIVGKLLHELANTAQVICITHLAQVAAHAQHHWRVLKQTDNNQTKTQMLLLTPELRIEEIARMIGGLKVTEQTLKYAKEILNIKK